MAKKLYLCKNADGCSLGTRGEAGYFTGGMTDEQANVITGKPVDAMERGVDYGQGICPNCGEAGEEVGTDG
jgi:hypothetical protein